MTDTDDSPNTLGSIAAFNDFLKDLAQRCDEQPVTQSATVVGSYRLLSP